MKTKFAPKNDLRPKVNGFNARLEERESNDFIAGTQAGVPAFLRSKPEIQCKSTGSQSPFASKISKPGDSDEIEADQMADRVMSGQAISIDTQRGTEDDSAIPSQPGTAFDSNGQPLEPNARTFFEPHFGRTFAGVRIHTGHQAVEAAQLLNAKAFTSGENIYFGAGEYQPYSRDGQHLIAHELSHTIQQAGASKSKIQRQNLTMMSIGDGFADRLSNSELDEEILFLREQLMVLPADTAEHLTAQENLVVLEQTAIRRDLAGAQYGSGIVDADMGGQDVLQSAFGLTDPAAESAMCVSTPVSSSEGEEYGMCIDPSMQNPPFVASGLIRETLLQDYRSKAREIMLFRVDAMYQWANIVVRRQITGPTGQGTEAAAATLSYQAEIANNLAYKVWESTILLNYYNELIDRYVPPPGSPIPELSRISTVGSSEYISTVFNREHLTSQGFPQEIPDIISILNRLGTRPAVTEEEITNYIVENAGEEALLEAGYNRLREEGRYIYWGDYVDPPFEWVGQPLTEPEIRQVGLSYIAQDPIQREQARMFLELDEERAPDPEEEAVLDVGAVHPAYNYDALRLVTNRLRAAAAAKLEGDRNRLNNHLDEHPLLRLYVLKWSYLLNLLGSGVVFDIDFEEIIDTTDIEAGNLVEKLQELLENLSELRDDIATDDDFLFDDAALGFLQPLIQAYESVDLTYGDWIREEFESNRKWESVVDTLLTAAGLLGIGLAGFFTGGAAWVVGGVGVAAMGALAIRSQMRAGDLENMASAGMADFDAVAIAEFKAWLDTAIAAMSAVSFMARGFGALVGRMLYAVRLGRITSTAVGASAAAGPNVQLATLLTRSLSAAEAAQAQAWGVELQQYVRQAVQMVDAGQGTTRWAQIFNGQGPLGGTALARGNAIHYEAFRLIRAGQLSGAPNILLNRGVANPVLGFLNGFGGVRPDIRIALTNGRELIFDITTFGMFGHAGQYGSRAWVEAIIEILY